MQSTLSCPTCNTPNRPTARFCVKCGASLAPAPIAANVAPAAVASMPTPVLSNAGAPPAAHVAPQPNLAPQAAASPRPRSFASKVARGFGRVLYFIARGLTLGGRATYTDLFAPQEIARGQVITLDRRPRPDVVEPGFVIWLFAWLVFALLLFLPLPWNVAAFILLYLVLLMLALPGWRFLGLSRSSAMTLFQFARTFKRGTEAQTQFTLQTAQGHVTVILRGALRGTMQQRVGGKIKNAPFEDADKTLAVNHLVRGWGMYEGNILRAWQLEFLEVDGTPARVWLCAPRVVPLTAALFIPLTFWFAAQILSLIFSRV